LKSHNNLNFRNRFYMDRVELAQGITSFFIHSHFLLLTTMSHTLQAVPIQPVFDEVKGAEDFW